MTGAYTSGEVANIVGIPKGTLVQWEREGKIGPIPRDENNNRVYSPEQLHEIVTIAGKVIFKRVSIVNQKGGVGKTTTTFNLGACLARRGQRVLVVDLDAQANLTISYGLNPDEVPLTTHDLLVDDNVDVEKVIRKTDYGNLDILPADIRLASADVKLREMIMREKILETKLEPIKERYNFILFDCPPNLSTITINALVASTDAIVPIEAQFYSMKAIDDLTSTFNLIRKKMNHSIRTWILPTKIDRRVKVHNGMLTMLQNGFSGRMLTSIRTCAKIGSAPMIKKPVVHSFPYSRSARDYEALTSEVLEE
jgi:chromosome partitioning protein